MDAGCPTDFAAVAEPAAQALADGVVCFAGVDWWYHNRGHSECQIMKRLAATTTVLWINSIGMRAPALGRTELPLRRYGRKLRSTLKGLRRDAESGMWIYSPLFIPRYSSRWVEVNGRLLDWQVRALCRWLGMRRPSAWITVPTAVGALERGRWTRTVFNRSDEFSRFPEADGAFIASLERRLLGQCDEVLYVNRDLMRRESGLCRSAEYLGHGVDFEHFAIPRSPDRADEVPAECRDLPRPVVGFYGALDDYLIDRPLLVKVARALPHATLLLIGPRAMDTAELEAEPNVRYLGPVPYERLPQFARLFDVGLMPWLNNGWVASCNPIKLKEYLALGFAVVSVDFPELAPYRHLVHAARTHDEFLDAVRRALATGPRDHGVENRRQAVRHDSWAALAQRAARRLGAGCE
jgi:hypothetical protein